MGVNGSGTDARAQERVWAALDSFRIEVPSWGFANTGTRFGKFTQAEGLYGRAIAISSRVYGEDHPSTAAAYGNLAIVLESQDRYREARTIKERVLQIDLRCYGEESEPVAIAYSNLGLHYERVANFVDSEKSYREIRSDFESEFERRYVAWLLDRHSGNISAAAREAKMDRKHLYDLARKRGLRGDR